MAIYVVSVEDLESGMVVAQPLIRNGGVPLVAQNVVLTSPLIEAIRRHGFQQIFIREGNDSDEEPISLISPESSREGRMKVEAVFSGAVERMTLSPRDVEVLSDLMSSVMEELSKGGPLFLGNLKAIDDMDRVTFDHCWSVAVLSLALHRKAVEAAWVPLGSFQDGVNLGLGAVLHDLGKLKIPPEILNKPGTLDNQEWETMRLHPWYGLEILRSQPNVMPMARGIVIHHHQRLDGKGYGPRHKENILEGNAIPKAVRIVTVADVYDALATDRPYRPGFVPWEVLKLMRSSVGTALDPVAFELLEQTVIPFPVGCFVLMKGGEICMITRSSMGDESPNPKGTPWARVLAVMSPKKGRLPGDLFGFSPEEVLLGASTLRGLAWRIARELSMVSEDLATKLNISRWAIHSEWRDRISKAFSKEAPL